MNTKNLRMRFSCWLISKAIATLPIEWQSRIAVKNLINTNAIKTNSTNID